MANKKASLFGDWKAAEKVVGRLPSDLSMTAHQWLEYLAKEGERIIVSTIDAQDFKPLSTDYKKQKVSRGYSPLILIRKSIYRSVITSEVYDNIAVVGIKKDRAYEDGTKVGDVAAYNEFGVPSRNLPKRPVFEPSKEALKKLVAIAKNYSNIYFDVALTKG